MPDTDRVEILRRPDGRGGLTNVLAMTLSKAVAESNGLACLSAPVPIRPDGRYRLSFRYRSDGPHLHVFVKGYVPGTDLAGQPNDAQCYELQVPPSGPTGGKWQTVVADLNPQNPAGPPPATLQGRPVRLPVGRHGHVRRRAAEGRRPADAARRRRCAAADRQRPWSPAVAGARTHGGQPRALVTPCSPPTPSPSSRPRPGTGTWGGASRRSAARRSPACGTGSWSTAPAASRPCGRPSAARREVLVLPEPTGLQRWNGHRIYAAASLLANTEFVCFLDEDNWFDDDHVASLVAAVRAGGGRWAFALRKIVDADGAFVTLDQCESLGSLHGPFADPADVHVDANCYLIGRELAVLVAPCWYSPTRPGDGRPEPDRTVARLLLGRAKPACTNGRHTVNYTVGNRPDSVPASFFLYGNRLMRDRYPAGLPWERR